jgi:hypothetical protein
MSDRWMGVVELVLVFGLVLGLAIRELVKLRRDNAATRQRDEHADTPAASAGAADGTGRARSP